MQFGCSECANDKVILMRELLVMVVVFCDVVTYAMHQYIGVGKLTRQVAIIVVNVCLH